MGIAIGVGLTNECNCNCPHCYSREHSIDYFDVEKLFKLCETAQIESVNFGTGESIYHPRFIECIHFFKRKCIPMSLTSNGYTVKRLTDEDLKAFNDIDISIDFPFRSQHDAFRDNGQFNLALEGIQRCKELSVECSVAMCLMNTNYMYVTEMINFCRELEINLRINVFKPVHTKEFTLSYTQFWEAIQSLLREATLISCSEPIVSLAIKDVQNKSLRAPCGTHSLRIKPSGHVVPCVYMTDSSLTIDDLIACAGDENKLKRILVQCSCENFEIPEECLDCSYKDICGGGCVSRRILMGGNKPDSHCFIKQGDLQSIPAKWAESKSALVHSDYLCTMIVK